MNLSIFNGKYDESAVTHVNHNGGNKFEHKNIIGTGPIGGKNIVKTSEISNSLQVFEGNPDDLYLNSQLDGTNIISHRNINASWDMQH